MSADGAVAFSRILSSEDPAQDLRAAITASELPTPSRQEMAAGVGRSRMRASAADREQVIDVLNAALVQGRLCPCDFVRCLAGFGSPCCWRAWVLVVAAITLGSLGGRLIACAVDAYVLEGRRCHCRGDGGGFPSRGFEPCGQRGAGGRSQGPGGQGW